MTQGGAIDTDDMKIVESIVNYVKVNPDLLKELESLLEGEESFKQMREKSENVRVKDVELLMHNEDLLHIVAKHFAKKKNIVKVLFEQANKVEGMEGKLETLGNRLLIQGVIGGAALTTLTGALAGTLAIGGVAGALITGGAALAGFLAILAIAAIAYVVYQQRGEIKEGAESLGKTIKSFVKDLIDKLPTIQARENNFAKLEVSLLKECQETQEEEKTILNNKIKIIEMLQNKEQLAAIRQLIVKDKASLLDNLMNKGTSTHEKEDMEKLVDFMNEFLPVIMAIGKGKIEEVEKIVNEKVQETQPKPQVSDPNSEKVAGTGKGVTP